MILRQLDVTDAERCVLLGGNRLGLTAAQYAEEFRRDDRQWLGVEIDGELVAFAGAWDAPDDCHLLAIAVARSRRRRGLGRALLVRLVEDAADRAAGPMTLEVRADNLAAIGLYRSCGFVETGRRPSYYRDADAVIMTRPPAHQGPTHAARDEGAA
ncbi:MAG: ribosomal protein S18-alanine N-acetyltransferase [Nitriliruptorales bacterium]|nr:ribosomal protein S18-alanine N-acetyltransferase [Nitriliruptorales bacterium]